MNTIKNTKNLKISFVLLIITLSFIQIKSDLSPDNVVLAINCGGQSFTDSKGVFYEKVKKDKIFYTKIG